MSDPFYHTKIWQDCREYILKRDKHLCQHCLKRKLITAADMVHHIKHLDKHPELALVADNLISLCDPCHKKAHKRGAQKAEPPKRKARIIKG